MHRLLVLLAVSLVACVQSPLAANVSTRRLPIETGDFSGIEWLPDDWLVFEHFRSPSAVTPAIRRVRLDGREESTLRLPRDPDCRLTRYHAPTRLPDGRLSLLKSCLQENPAEDRFQLVAYDLQTEELEPLMANDLGFRSVGPWSWDPTLQRGIVSNSNRICATLLLVTRQGFESTTIRIEDDGQTYMIDGSLFETSAPNCDDEPRADFPAWSPNGGAIAFFFSAESAGVAGQDRLDAPWNLYLMNAETLAPTKALEDVRHPQGLRWSPNGRWLAFAGTVEDESGTWLYSPSTRDLHRLTEEALGSFDWSPTGMSIVAVRTLPGSVTSPLSDIIVLDVSGVT